MKKNILLVLMFIGMFFIGGTDVFALTCKVGDKDCTPERIAEVSLGGYPICIYEVNFDGKKYYNYLSLFQQYELAKVMEGEKYSFFGGTTRGIERDLRLTTDFSDNQNRSYITKEAYKKLIENGECPANSYIDISGTNTVCFDNDNSCQNGETMFNDDKKEKEQSSVLIDNYNFGKMLLYKDVAYTKACSIEENQSEYKVCRYNSKGTTGNDIIFYYNGKTNFISMYDANAGNRFVVSERLAFSKQYNNGGNNWNSTKIINNINKQTSSCPQNLFLYKKADTLEFYSSAQEIEYKSLETFELIPCITETPPQVEPDPEDCEDLIGGKLREYINTALNIIRIGVPILLIGLLIFDFATAMFSSSDDKMAKAKSKAIKRIVIAIIIFFVPTFINLVFDLVNDIWQKNFEICGIDK